MKVIRCLKILAVSGVMIISPKISALAEDAAGQKLVGGSTSTDFSFKLFNALLKESKENVLISPFSTYAALSMVLNGADGNTRDQMAKTLGVASDTIALLNSRNRSIIAELNTSSKVKLKIANAIFADKSSPFKKSFSDICKQIYDAKAESFNFHDNFALKNINDWVDVKTAGKIPIIIDKFKPDEKMVVLNAVYFKGDWASPFKVTDTDDDKFITSSGDITDIKMMHKRQKLFYFKSDTFKAIAIPYAGEHQSLCIFLPNKKSSLSLFEAEFNEQSWDEWTNSFRLTEVNLSLPKFSIRFAADISSGLKSIGMADAFNATKADFSKMLCFGYSAALGRVLEKTYMDVDEKGTEAAAATAATICVKSVSVVSPQPIEFRVDHPFVVALVDNDSKEILFLGSIVKP